MTSYSFLTFESLPLIFYGLPKGVQTPVLALLCALQD